MKNLTTRVPNYTQIYFPYSTVTSACQGSLLACTCTVTILRILTYIKMRLTDLNYRIFIKLKTNIHSNHVTEVFDSPKQTILHRHRN